MDFTKILAAGIVVLLAAGAVAAGGTGSAGSVAPSMDTPSSASVTNADVEAGLDNETVTLTLVDTGAGERVGVANATVEVTREYVRDDDDEDVDEDESGSAYVGETDVNGTIAFALTPTNESRPVTGFEVQFTTGAFEAELDYRVDNGSLVLIEEAYEYADEDRDDEERADNETAQHSDDERLRVSMADARATADAALAEPPQGSWRLVEADAPDEDPYYEFEYVLVDAESEGEAEIRVHAESGAVIEYEEEIDGRENERSDEGERENDDERDEDEREDDDERNERVDEDDEREDDERETENNDEREDDDEDEDDEDEDDDERETEDDDDDEDEREDD